MMPGVIVRSHVELAEAWQPIDVASFAGRWNPRRSIPDEVEPGASAAAQGLLEAGWWRPGQAAGCEGGLVALVGGTNWQPAARFATALADSGDAPLGPRDFLFALPSTVAAVLGILYGFTDYQATLAGAGAGGEEEAALRHAARLLAGGRIERALVVALGDRQGARRAAAWCLEAIDG